ncbi:MAG: hypothetical protein Q9168_005695 [Polycauliona sp. 1 TL-2023]
MDPLIKATTVALLMVALPPVQALDEFATPQKALLPAVHWNHDKSDLQHLVPVDSHKLYYSANGVADPTLEHAFGHLEAAMAHPAVILDHTDHIKSVQCRGHDLEIIFTDHEAFAFAQTAWAKEKDFLLATFTIGCGSSTEQRTFWLVDHFVTGRCDTCITAVVEREVPVEEAVHGADIVWGTYKPLEDPPKVRRSELLERQVPGNNNSATGACGPAPSDRIDGLPTANCGSPTFDQDLDDKIGYLHFDADDYSRSLEKFVPGLDDFDPADNEGFGVLQNANTTRLTRRQKGGWFGDRVAKALAATFNKAAEKLRELPAAVIQAATKVATQVVNALSISREISLKFPLDVASPNRKNITTSPWGDALVLFNKSKESTNFGGGRGAGTLEGSRSGQLTVYCVGCGVRGEVQLSGQATWTVSEGLQRAQISVNGNINAGLSLGIDAIVQTHQVFDYPITAVGIPGFSIPGFIIVGPSLSLAAVAELNVSLAGQVLTGVQMEIADFAATVDFVNGSNSKSANLVPRLTPVFNATAQFSATLALGLPLSLGIGVQIPPLKFKKTASINEAPSVEASLNFTASTTNVGVNGNTDCVNGIGYNVQFVNAIYANLFGLFKYDLHRYTKEITTGCKRYVSSIQTSLIPFLTSPLPSFGAAPPSRRALIDSPRFKHRSKRQEPEGIDGPEPYDYVESITTNATSANDTLFQLSSAATLDALDATANSANGSQVPFAPDTDFFVIHDLSGNDELVADQDGNIYYAAPGNGSLFASVSGFVEGDASGRFFHYYTDTMITYNVSRLRLSDEAHIPLTAEFVGLAPVNYDEQSSTPDVYVAMDTNNGVFFPVTCDIQGEESKAFLVTDIAQGVARLKEENLRYTVTGGVVLDCYFLPWAAPNGSADAIPGSMYPLSAAANLTATNSTGGAAPTFRPGA